MKSQKQIEINTKCEKAKNQDRPSKHAMKTVKICRMSDTWKEPSNSVCKGTWIPGEWGYNHRDAQKLFKNKLVVFIGDSVTRGCYKDFVKFIRTGDLVSRHGLKNKGELSYQSDRLVEGGTIDGLSNGKGYIEVREYMSDYLCVRFYFVTRCYYDYVETILQDFQQEPYPDLVYMNSTVWDVTRWTDERKIGVSALSNYKANLEILFNRLKETLPPYTHMIWSCGLPLGQQVRGGFLQPGAVYKHLEVRKDILEANHFASIIAIKHGFDVLDFHFHLMKYPGCREFDGIHWNSRAHRNLTYMLICFVAESWNFKIQSSRLHQIVMKNSHQRFISSHASQRMDNTSARLFKNGNQDYFYDQEKKDNYSSGHGSSKNHKSVSTGVECKIGIMSDRLKNEQTPKKKTKKPKSENPNLIAIPNAKLWKGKPAFDGLATNTNDKDKKFKAGKNVDVIMENPLKSKEKRKMTHTKSYTSHYSCVKGLPPPKNDAPNNYAADILGW